MADQYLMRTLHPMRSPSGYQAAPRSSDRVPIYREVPAAAHSPGMAHAPDGNDDAPESFWGHYVEDRLRHFSRESR
jgi:hypothetical protein